MKKIIYIIITLSFSIFAKEKLVTDEISIDVVSAATSKAACGRKNCWASQVCIGKEDKKCINKCSPRALNGACEPGKICKNGSCISECIVDKSNKCISGKLCKEEKCIENSCKNIENGYCDPGYICKNNECKNNRCSKEIPNGYCVYKKKCNNGVCEEIVIEETNCSYNSSPPNFTIFLLFFSLFLFRKRENK